MKDPKLKEACHQTAENLNAMSVQLDACINSGMTDYSSQYYNSLNELQDDIELIKTWDELDEIIIRAKTLENDFDTWLSLKGRSTIGLIWPNR